MSWLITLFGVGLIALVLRDIFHTLFTPNGSGSLSSHIARAVWKAAHAASRRRPDRLSLAGPVAMVLIILLWMAALVIGWALLLWPHLPEEFLLATGLDPERNDGLLDAIYVSSVALGTLGYGEITPQTTWLRLVAPLEALIGFALLTAAVSWIMSIYPALGRRRQLAREVSLLQRTHLRDGRSVEDADAQTMSSTLRNLTSQVIAVSNDFVQFPITYYFRSSDRASSFEAGLQDLVSLARRASERSSPQVRLDATQLLEALRDLTTHLAETWLDCDDDADIGVIARAYAADHLYCTEPSTPMYSGA